MGQTPRTQQVVMDHDSRMEGGTGDRTFSPPAHFRKMRCLIPGDQDFRTFPEPTLWVTLCNSSAGLNGLEMKFSSGIEWCCNDSST